MTPKGVSQRYHYYHVGRLPPPPESEVLLLLQSVSENSLKPQTNTVTRKELVTPHRIPNCVEDEFKKFMYIYSQIKKKKRQRPIINLH